MQLRMFSQEHGYFWKSYVRKYGMSTPNVMVNYFLGCEDTLVIRSTIKGWNTLYGLK